MWEPMCSSGQGLLHSSIVKSLAWDVAGFSRPIRWYSEPLQLTHISIERVKLVPGLFPRTWLATPSLWHIWRRFSLCYVVSTWRHCHLTPGQEKTEATRRDSAFGQLMENCVPAWITIKHTSGMCKEKPTGGLGPAAGELASWQQYYQPHKLRYKVSMINYNFQSEPQRTKASRGLPC